MSKPITVALAGNPNSGKTTIFNAITGARQRVGNYPGVTVERKQGERRHRGRELHLTDLPGTYDLTPTSPDEQVASDHLVNDAPDVVVCIVDSTNLERNLYLAVQLRELGLPVVLAFNMSDVAVGRGMRFDLRALSRRLGTPIVPTVGHKGDGIEDLLDEIVEAADRAVTLCAEAGVSGSTSGSTDPSVPLEIPYGDAVEDQLRKVEELITRNNGHVPQRQVRWHAVKMLETDSHHHEIARVPEVREAVAAAAARITRDTGAEPVAAIVGGRYQFITDLCNDGVSVTGELRETRSARIDSVLTHRVFGLPIFFGLMFLVFQLTFTLANPIADQIEVMFGWLGGVVGGLWAVGSTSPLRSLLVDGVIGGVGGVLVFLPNIVMLFLAISILEDTGYMARAAFMMDRLMSRVGLHGKSFIPMLLGFGCSVPAIMATRTLDTRRDRLTTMLVVPLMSCSARLTIYALIIPAFYPPAWQGPMLWLMYLIGIVLAIAVANLLRSTIFRGEKSAFLMELPAYHAPTLRSVVTQMWSRASIYVRKAGTVILGISILLWTLAAFPRLPDGAAADVAAGNNAGAEVVAGEADADPEAARYASQLSYSIVGRLGRAMEPLISPMGFDWKIGSALVGAFAAKEVFVAQMGIVYSVGEVDASSDALRDRLRAAYPPLVGFCILLFALIASPCMATVAIVKREANSWRWALFQLGGLTALGYALTVIVFQTGRALGIGI